MKAVYDPKTDTLTIRFKTGTIAESDESKPGVILDYDKDGGLLGLEILDASVNIAQTRSMEFEVAA